jgi:hypothetical protein
VHTTTNTHRASLMAWLADDDSISRQQHAHQWAPKTLKNSTLNTLFLIFSKTLKIAIFKNCFAIFKGVFLRFSSAIFKVFLAIFKVFPAMFKYFLAIFKIYTSYS